jgi:hypothetical protein
MMPDSQSGKSESGPYQAGDIQPTAFERRAYFHKQRRTWMQGSVDNFRRTIEISQLAICSLLLSLCLLPATLSAQGAAPKTPHCFAINVHLNGQSIDGPQAITLKTRKVENTLSLDQKCFPVPDAIIESELVEVSFTLPGNKIHMSDIPTDFFSGMWDVDLADKKFGKDVVIPKHANPNEVCAVVFHAGDQMQSLSQAQCRTPIGK